MTAPLRLPLLEPHRSALEKCVYCPKLSRAACPVSNVEASETVTPWGKMSMAFFAARGDVPIDVEHAAPHHRPQSVMVGGVARRGTAHVFRAFEAVAIHVGGGQREILRTRLAPDLEPPLLRPGDLVGNLGAGHMEHLDRRVDKFGEGNGPVGSLPFHDLGPRPGMIFGRRQSRR